MTDPKWTKPLPWFSLRCWWLRKHRWRTLWHFESGMAWGFRCDRCMRTTDDLMATLKQGQMKGWMM